MKDYARKRINPLDRLDRYQPVLNVAWGVGMLVMVVAVSFIYLLLS